MLFDMSFSEETLTTMSQIEGFSSRKKLQSIPIFVKSCQTDMMDRLVIKTEINKTEILFRNIQGPISKFNKSSYSTKLNAK